MRAAHAWVHASVRACVHASVHACARASYGDIGGYGSGTGGHRGHSSQEVLQVMFVGWHQPVDPVS